MSCTTSCPVPLYPAYLVDYDPVKHLHNAGEFEITSGCRKAKGSPRYDLICKGISDFRITQQEMLYAPMKTRVLDALVPYEFEPP